MAQESERGLPGEWLAAFRQKLRKRDAWGGGRLACINPERLVRSHTATQPRHHATASSHHTIPGADQLLQIQVIKRECSSVLHLTLRDIDAPASRDRLQMAIVLNDSTGFAAVSWCLDSGRGVPSISVANIVDIHARERTDHDGLELVVRAIDEDGSDYRILFSHGMTRGSLVCIDAGR